MRLVVASTIGWKTHISLFDDESEPCSGFEARRRCKNSARFTPRCTIISIRSAVSSRARFTNRDARLRWPSGAPLRRRSPSASGHVAPRAGDRCYSDKAEKAADELGRVERHGPKPVAVFDPVVLPFEGDAGLVERDQP